MKKVYLFFLVLISFNLQAQFVNIPDVNLRTKLISLYPSCFNGSQQMDTTCNAVVTEDTLILYSLNLTDLNGVQYFDQLLYLDCTDNLLTSLPVLANSITMLGCSANHLTSLPRLPSSLRNLSCAQSNLSSLPALPDSLRTLICYSNKLTSLPALPNKLNYIHCSMNQLTSFPSFPDSLGWLMCDGNDLLTCFPLFPTNFAYLNYGSSTGITCVPNLPILITWPYPVCPAGSQCEPHPNASGIVYEDINTNGVYDDLVDHLLPNRLISSSANRVSTTSIYGQYQIKLDSGIANTFKVTPLMPYYTITPSDFTITPVSRGSQGNQFNFAIQPIPGIQDLKVNIASGRARPGFNQWVAVNVNNMGTVNVSNGTLKVLKPTGFTLTDAYPTISSQSGDTLIWTGVNVGSLAHPEFKLKWKIPATAVLGHTFDIHAWIVTTTADSTPTNNYCFLTNVFQGSFDPNDKTVSKSILSPSSVNDELIYTVRFQNTGTDTAFNVVIKDELSEYLDRSSFQMIGASHPYTYQIRDNGLLEVFFQDILLPDSNINEPLSHGYFQYSVKPKAILYPNDTIFNSAAIYFDFNTPVITNTVKTYLQYPANISEQYTSEVIIYPNPTSGETTIVIPETSGTVSVTDLNGKELFTKKIARKSVIDLSSFSSGIYVVKIATSKGSVVRRMVKE